MDIYDTERARLQNALIRLNVVENFARSRNKTLAYVYRPDTFEVDRIEHVRYNNVFPAVRLAPGFEVTVFKLTFIKIGCDSYACIKADGLVLVDPWRWTGWETIPVEVG